MSLENRISKLSTNDRHLEDWSNTRIAWLAGFDTGLYEAATLAAEADELMREMVEFLQSANFDNNTDMRESDALVKKYKEQTNER